MERRGGGGGGGSLNARRTRKRIKRRRRRALFSFIYCHENERRIERRGIATSEREEKIDRAGVKNVGARKEVKLNGYTC